jgi:hypothetical protein
MIICLALQTPHLGFTETDKATSKSRDSVDGPIEAQKKGDLISATFSRTPRRLTAKSIEGNASQHCIKSLIVIGIAKVIRHCRKSKARVTCIQV